MLEISSTHKEARRSPVEQIPVEVALEIFRHFCRVDLEGLSKLSLVCKLWQSYVIEMPELWRIFVLDPTDELDIEAAKYHITNEAIVGALCIPVGIGNIGKHSSTPFLRTV